MLRRILNSPWFYFGLAALLAVMAVLSQFRLSIPTRSQGGLAELRQMSERDDLNVVFLLVDTLRADRLGCYGYDRPTSPVIDSLADAGVRFDHVEAQSSWTKTSMASIWTGLTPSRTGVTRFHHALPSDATLAAELLRDAGFRTMGVFRNGWVAANFGFQQGFEGYVRPVPSQTPERLERRELGEVRIPGSDQDANEAAIEFVRAHAHERFFLYVHYMDVHQSAYDQVAAAQGFGTSYSDAYDAAIHWTDRAIAQLLQVLEDLDVFDRTVVVIASDHGEGFYEHGLEYHARTLYREVTEVPLILVLPFLLKPGVVVETPVRNLDIWPTILDLVGLPPLPDADGRSLVPLIESALSGTPGDGEAPPAFAYLDKTWGRSDRDPDPLVAVQDGAWRLIYRTQHVEGAELFDRATDPLEQENLAEREPERLEALRAEAEARLADEVPWGEVPEVEIDDMRLEQLRALGYVEAGRKGP